MSEPRFAAATAVASFLLLGAAAPGGRALAPARIANSDAAPGAGVAGAHP